MMDYEYAVEQECTDVEPQQDDEGTTAASGLAIRLLQVIELGTAIAVFDHAGDIRILVLLCQLEWELSSEILNRTDRTWIVRLAPLISSFLTMRPLPDSTARCSGVNPYILSWQSISLPQANRAFTELSLPL